MERIDFGYSLKNIPVGDEKTFCMTLFNASEKTQESMKWKVLKTFNPENFGGKKQTFGFPTTAAAPDPKPECPSYKPMKDFKEGMLDLVSTIEFNTNTNELQKKLKKDMQEIKKDKHL